jgi:hypothetical protein
MEVVPMTLMLAMAVLVAVGVWATLNAARALLAWRRLRGPRAVTCPNAGQPAGVQIDLRHMVAAAIAGKKPAIRIASCSRWPEHAGCGEACLGDATNPENTTRRIAERGFKDKTCIYCRKPVGDPHFLDHYPALRGSDDMTLGWPDIPPEQLRDAFQASTPVCWNCHIAELFRREHPELVTTRVRPH